MTKYDYAVTFESPETAPPETLRGTCTGGSWSTGAAHAITAARKARPGRRFESVLVLLSRSEVQDAPTASGDTVKRGFARRKMAEAVSMSS